MEVVFSRGALAPDQQSVISEGFTAHTKSFAAPAYRKERVNWVALSRPDEVEGALTADLLWDWMYIDELWVSPEARGMGLGRSLLEQAEQFAVAEHLEGTWLWTQSWQAEGFYRQLGYEEFARFDNFPRGHSRIGFRKYLIE